MKEILQSYLDATGRRRPIVSLPIPGRAVASLRAGANIALDRAVGKQTWEEFLAERVGPPSTG